MCDAPYGGNTAMMVILCLYLLLLGPSHPGEGTSSPPELVQRKTSDYIQRGNIPEGRPGAPQRSQTLPDPQELVFYHTDSGGNIV